MRGRARGHMLVSSPGRASYAALLPEETMADADPNSPAPDPARAAGPAWLPWLAWGWVAILVLAAAAELGGFDDLRLALDLQRHFR